MSLPTPPVVTNNRPSPRSTDPQTGRPLRDRRLMPNPCVRHLIAACCKALRVGPAAAPGTGDDSESDSDDCDWDDSDSDMDIGSPGGPMEHGPA